MRNTLLRTPKAIMFILVLTALAFIISCGGTAATAVPQATATAAPTTVPAPAAAPTDVPAPAAAPTDVPAPGTVPTAVPTAVPAPAAAPRAVGIQGGVPPIMAYAAPLHWYIWECPTTSCMIATAPLYNQLIESNPDTLDPTDIRGDLANSWDTSADGLTYTFYLDENARWWDGQPVTADDVVFSLNQMVDEVAPRPRSGLIRAPYESSRVVNAKTVEVTTKFPSAAFLLFLGTEYNKILPKHHLETGVNMKLSENALGSGPFTLVDEDIDVGYEYARNDDYFKEGRPYWDGMKAYIIKDSGTAIAAFKAKQILLSSAVNNLMVPQILQLGIDTEGQGTVTWAGGSFQGMFINTKVAPFDNPKVRLALQLAVHRQPLIEIVTAGTAKMGGPFPPNSWYTYTEDELAEFPGFRELNGEKHPEDIARARELLAEAGFPNGFETTLTARQVSNYVANAQILVDQLDRFLNIKANVRVMESVAGKAAFRSGDFQLGMGAGGAIIPDPDSVIGDLFGPIAGYNPSGWEVPRLSELFELQSKELDRDKRRELLLEAADIMMFEDTEWVGLYWGMTGRYHDNSIQNYHAPSSEATEAKFEHTWCDPAC